MDNQYDYTIADFLNELTRAMHVTEDSNWYQYFQIWQPVIQDIQDQQTLMRNANDLDNCTGSMLDDEARNLGIVRNGVDDEFLRFEIKAKKLARTCDGTLPKLYNLIATALGCKPSEFKIQSIFEIDGSTPNAIQVADIPATYMSDKRRVNLLRDTIQDAVADGIRVVSLTFQELGEQGTYIVPIYQVEHEINASTEGGN